jgi:hypothetical protein
LARSAGDDSAGKGGGNRRKVDKALKLVRVESSARSSVSLVFEGNGEERVWRLEQTSIIEFFALLLHGRMHRGRRVMLADAELTFEPADGSDDDPKLCMTMGTVELCAPMARADVRALKADIDRSLRR